MPRKLVRVVLIAALTLGVLAMHSFGHGEHSGQSRGQMIEVAQSLHYGHEQTVLAADDETDPSSPLTVIGLMVCGAIMFRLFFDFFRSGVWSRLWDRLLTLAARPERAPARDWSPPPSLSPTGIRLNRVAVLRI